MRFYPFVFTGKERDEETGYGYFGARYMDHELMTSFLSVDRYADKYPSISPYAYCAWNPVKLTDPTGDTIYYRHKNVDYYYTQSGNDFVWKDHNGNEYLGGDPWFDEFSRALQTLRDGAVGDDLVSRIAEDDRHVQLLLGNGDNKSDKENGKWVRWNPRKEDGNFLNEDGSSYRPSYIGLGHELAHIDDVWNGTNDQTPWFTIVVKGKEHVVPKCEIKVGSIENKLREEHGVPLRMYYFYFEDIKAGLLINK